MEKIKIRSMTAFAVSTLINVGIGIGSILIGFLMSIISISTGGFLGYVPLSTLFIYGGIGMLFIQNIYRVYFYYSLSIDVDAVCKSDGLESGSYLISVALSTITFGLYDIYWTYKLGQRLHANAPRYGFKMIETGKDIAVLNAFSFGFLAANELIRNMNKFARVYNQNLGGSFGGVQ